MISNSLFNSLVSGNEVLLKENLLSISSHLCNVHDFEDNIEYKECPHGDLGERPWLDKDSLVYMA